MNYRRNIFSILPIFLLLFAASLSAQTLSGIVRDAENKPMPKVQMIIKEKNLREKTAADGSYIFKNIPAGKYTLIAFKTGFKTESQTVEIGENDLKIDVILKEISYETDEVVVERERQKTLGIAHLNSVEGTAIYEGKKSEIVDISQVTGNLATNNARQVFAKVAGLNIWESDGAGMQLGIGGRGLSPNRSSNFNTRQNGYDISADALGYPESYYTPPVEALERIEVVRGASSLQYGTQFGGIVNFVFKKGEEKPFGVNTRQTVGSFGLLTSFNSIGGTIGNTNYYAFYQHKQGGGWRPNSDFATHTAFASVNFAPTDFLKIGAEYTFMTYNAQQPGGLTDRAFDTNARVSTRKRNWFKVDWNLAALTLDYKFSNDTKLNSRMFGLIAERDALGFMEKLNVADSVIFNRDLLKDKFRNWGNETRLLHNYELFENPAIFLVGTRYYNGFTDRKQGNGTAGSDANYSYLNPDNLEHSDYDFPSQNFSAFTENIFNLSEEWSITPGARFEWISTNSEGYYKERNTDFAGNVIFEQKINEEKSRDRSLVLFGLGTSFRPNSLGFETYANISQNYRSINFNDLRIVNPNFKVDENIRDERGYNADLGIRGSFKNILNYDISAFYLAYQDRIGSVLKTDETSFIIYRYRTNVADSRNIGVETFAELDFLKLFCGEECPEQLSVFSNLTWLDARYINTENTAIKNKKVELVPDFLFKSGLTFKTGGLNLSYQFTYTSEQFTDATNARYTASAVDGIVPAYFVMDISGSYAFSFLKIEAGVNNLMDERYFTRRASGYPGPGIIPSDGRSFYATLQATF
ncbi:MAG: TonB-dependent receptor [Bacteroidota bacterium]